MPSIGIIVPRSASGGVATEVWKLYRGLSSEGFKVSLHTFGGDGRLNVYLRSLLPHSFYRYHDLLIFTGSTPPLFSLFMPSNVGKALFVHGFTAHELLNALRHHDYPPIMRIAAVPMLLRWITASRFERFDLFICHTLTSCEVNGLLDRDHVLLPQFVLSDEIEEVRMLVSGSANIGRWQTGEGAGVRILTYSSHIHSPRLLPLRQIARLMRIVSMKASKNVHLTIIDPKAARPSTSKYGNLVIDVIPAMPKRKFLELLASADLYLESNTDEELRYGSIEAGLVGTPVAKITYPRFINRQDYGEGEVILGVTAGEFVEKLSEFIDRIDYYGPLYSRSFGKFIAERRSWDSVKGSFIDALERLADL